MSRKSPKLELKLNLSPPTPSQRRMVRSPTRSASTRSASTSPISAPSSCVSSEMDQDETYSTSPEATSSMVLVGCPRCLMYVMLSEDDPKCPKCKNTVLLDFQRENASNANAEQAASSSGRKSRRN